MLPIDDPSWPYCGEKSCDNSSAGIKGWCSHIRDSFVANEDAGDFQPGMNYCVPIVPEYNLYAQVNLGTDIVCEVPRMVDLSLVLPEPESVFVPLDPPDLISLGLHVEGEGRIEIAYNVLSWMEAYADPKCTDPKHSYPQEMHFQQITRNNQPMDLKANAWCMAYYKKCWPCRIAELNPAQPATPSVQMNAAAFGLDDTVRDTGPAQNAAQAALQNRFGNRRA